MKIQIVSDLHLEFRGKDIYSILVPSAPILCMVGDICVCGAATDFRKFIHFLKYFTTKFEAIIHVAGNHEYYTAHNAQTKELMANTIPEIDKRLRLLTKYFPNYHYLNNTTWTYESARTKRKYVFVGTTLWSHIPKKKIIIDAKKNTTANLADLIQKRMNDYNYIYVPCKLPNGMISCRKYCVADMQRKHRAAVLFLRRIIAQAKAVCTKSKPPPIFILLTHHKPLFDRATDQQDEYTYAYESDLANVILTAPFSVAAHGHTHQHYDKRINGVRVVSNPKGYIGEGTAFNDKFTINV